MTITRRENLLIAAGALVLIGVSLVAGARFHLLAPLKDETPAAPLNTYYVVTTDVVGCPSLDASKTLHAKLTKLGENDDRLGADTETRNALMHGCVGLDKGQRLFVKDTGMWGDCVMVVNSDMRKCVWVPRWSHELE